MRRALGCFRFLLYNLAMGRFHSIFHWFFILAATWVAKAAHADPIEAPDRIFLLVGSHHALPLAETFPYDETNPGILLGWDKPIQGFDLAFGVYENSFSDISGILALGKTWALTDTINLRALIGVSNYDEEDPIFQPLGGGLVIIPFLQINWRNAFVQATPLPDPDNAGIVFTYGLTFEF